MSGLEQIHRELLAASEKARGASGQSQIIELSIHSKPYSELMRVRSRDGPRERTIWIKHPRITERNADVVEQRIRTEYELLLRLHRHFAHDKDHGVVKPIAILDSPLALVTEEARGATLQRTLNRDTRLPAVLWRSENLKMACWRCGRWLGLFHELTRVDESTERWDDTVAYCAPRLQRLVMEPNSGVDERLAQRIRERLDECVQRARAVPAQISGRHNDFAGHNVILTSEGRVVVLDFSMFDHDSPAFDCFNFIHNLEQMRCDLRTPNRLVTRLIDAFTEGYGEEFPDAEPLRKIVRCRLDMTKLLTQVVRTPRGPGARLEQWRLQRMYRTSLQEFASQPLMDQPGSQTVGAAST